MWIELHLVFVLEESLVRAMWKLELTRQDRKELGSSYVPTCNQILSSQSDNVIVLQSENVTPQ